MLRNLIENVAKHYEFVYMYVCDVAKNSLHTKSRYLHGLLNHIDPVGQSV